MSFRAIFHPMFESDADAAKAWYEDQLPGLGDRFEAQLENCVAVIVERPLSIRISRGQLRYATLRDFPYGVVFRIDENLLLIGGVFHTARDRSLWDSRY